MLVFLLFLLIDPLVGNSVTVVRKNSSPSIHTLPFPNSIFQHKIRGHQTDETFVLFEAEYLDEGPGYHLHKQDDELFYILEGKVQFIVNGSQFCAAAGDYVYIPRHVPQGIRVFNTTRPVKIQIMLFPAGLDHFLDEIALLYDRNRNNWTAIDSISEKYGLVDLGPVQWEDLHCFDNFSIQLSSSLSIVLFFLLIKYILQ